MFHARMTSEATIVERRSLCVYQSKRSIASKEGKKGCRIFFSMNGQCLEQTAKAPNGARLGIFGFIMELRVSAE